MNKTKENGIVDLGCISERGERTGSHVDFMLKFMKIVSKNTYDELKNAKGIINMGTAVNRLMETELQDRLRRDDVMRFTPADHQHYFDFGGTPRLKEALTDFFSRHFTGGRKIPSEQLTVINGVNSCLDAVAYGCCDAGDVMITPTPVYGRIFSNFEERAFVDVRPLYLGSANAAENDGEEFKLTGEALEQRIKELTSEGKKVKAFVLVNPQNPIGCLYGNELLMTLLQVCARHKVHAIVDEIYALSVHSADTKFKSVLSFDKLPDPDRTHFMWGLSKDFGLAGMRLAVIQTSNRRLQRYLNVSTTFYGTPSIVQDSMATLLMDKKWCDNFFLPTSQRRVAESYQRAVLQLKAAGLKVFESTAGLFAWIDVSPYLKNKTYQDELGLFEEFLFAGVYLVPGSVLRCPQPGWFRMIVSLPREEIRIGITRFLSVLHARRRPSNINSSHINTNLHNSNKHNSNNHNSNDNNSIENNNSTDHNTTHHNSTHHNSNHINSTHTNSTTVNKANIMNLRPSKKTEINAWYLSLVH